MGTGAAAPGRVDHRDQRQSRRDARGRAAQGQLGGGAVRALRPGGHDAGAQQEHHQESGFDRVLGPVTAQRLDQRQVGLRGQRGTGLRARQRTAILEETPQGDGMPPGGSGWCGGGQVGVARQSMFRPGNRGDHFTLRRRTVLYIFTVWPNDARFPSCPCRWRLPAGAFARWIRPTRPPDRLAARRRL